MGYGKALGEEEEDDVGLELVEEGVEAGLGEAEGAERLAEGQPVRQRRVQQPRQAPHQLPAQPDTRQASCQDERSIALEG